MSAQQQCGKRSREWVFYKLKLTSHSVETDKELVFDEMTWRQFINNSLKKSHGLFGEACEYYFLNQDGNIAYVKVFMKDAATFESAISTFISSKELTEVPVLALILQRTNDICRLDISEDDSLWHKAAVSNEIDDGSNDK